MVANCPIELHPSVFCPTKLPSPAIVNVTCGFRFSIAGDGSFVGQNTLGCNSMGQFATIDADFNLYEVQSTIADCALAGEYIGLAFLGDLLVTNDVLILANDNGSRAFLTGFEK